MNTVKLAGTRQRFSRGAISLLVPIFLIVVMVISVWAIGQRYHFFGEAATRRSWPASCTATCGQVNIGGECAQGIPCKRTAQRSDNLPTVSFGIKTSGCKAISVDTSTNQFTGTDTPNNTWLSAATIYPAGQSGDFLSNSWNFCNSSVCWTFNAGQTLYWRLRDSYTNQIKVICSPFTAPLVTGSTPTPSPVATIAPSPSPKFCSLGMFIKFQDITSNGPAQKFVTLSAKDPGTNNVRWSFDSVRASVDTAPYLSNSKSDIYRIGIGNFACGTYDMYIGSSDYQEKKFPNVLVDDNPWNDPETYLLYGSLIPAKIIGDTCAIGSVDGATFSQTYQGQNGTYYLYNISSGATAKIAVNVSPTGAYVDWKIATFSQNLPDGGSFSYPNSNDTSVVNWTAPSNPKTTDEGVDVRGDISEYPNPWKYCPTITFAVKPR